MRIIDRYVIRSFVWNYLITLFVLIGLYIVLDMVFNFDELVEVKGEQVPVGAIASIMHVAHNVFDYYFYQTFLIFTNLSPVIPGVAAAFTLIRLSRSNELVAILAAGVPLLRVVTPIIVVAVILSSLVIVNQELVIPRMIDKLTRKHDQVGSNFRIKAEPINGIRDAQTNAFFRAARYTPATPSAPPTIEYLDVLDRTADGQVVGHLSADRAVWDGESRRWILTNGRYVSGLAPGSMAEAPRAVTELRSTVTPEVIALYRSMDVAELLSTARINEMLASPQAFGTHELVKVKHVRWAGIFLNWTMLLLTIPGVLSREPRIDLGMAVKSGILIALVMGLVFITQNLATSPPNPQWLDQWAALMAFLPVFIFAPIAVYLLTRVKS